MKKKRLWLLSILLVVFIPFSFVLAIDDAPHGLGDRVPGEILIGFEPNVTSCQIKAVVSSIGGQVIDEVNLPDVKIRRVKLSSTAPSAIDAAINSVKTNKTLQDKIKYVEPNIIQKIFGDAGILSQSSDPLLSQQWGYYDIGANWLNAPPATAPIIAVIDTGVDYTHPDLKGKVIKGYDYVNSDADPMDDHGHGTHVSGIAAAITNNAYGIAGVSWNSKVLAVKVCNPQGSCSGFDIVKGIQYAADYPGVKVLNMSLGGGYSAAEESAVEYAVNTKKKLLVASAGNDNTDVKSYPAGLATDYGLDGKVLAVAAHGTDHCKASFSNYGDWVSITAPGVDILSTVPNSMGTYGFDSWDGTSMASPFVAGAAAAAWAKYPTYLNTQIANLITTNHAGLYDPLLRDGICWPNDGSTFERLDVLHMLESSFYEVCLGGAKGQIFGYALDAETGEPLAGAKAVAKQGLVVTGTDYVPYYGYLTFLADGIYQEGYGLFNVLTSKGDNTLKLKKTGYATPTFTNISVDACYWSYAGNIPVPPNKSKYWLAVTWDYGYADSSYYSVLYVPSYGYVDYVDTGNLNDIPWAKHLWNSLYGEGNLRDFSEVIRIKKTVSGTYLFYVVDFGIGAGSTSWADSGIKAYIYKWDSATSTQKLVKTYTPPAGPTDAGQFWVICTIDGNTITDQNFLSD
jgi:thermitase